MGERIPPESADKGRSREPRPLDYVRPATNAAEKRPLPVAAGLGVGFCVFLGTVAMWWPIGRASESGFFLGLGVVPLIALVVGAVLQGAFGWRGVVAGVLTAIGLAVLIPGVALLVICGGMRLK